MDSVADPEESTGFEPDFVKESSVDKASSDIIPLPEKAPDIVPLPDKDTIDTVATDNLLHQDPFERENTTFTKCDNSLSSNEELVVDTNNIGLDQASDLPSNSNVDIESVLSESSRNLNDESIDLAKHETVIRSNQGNQCVISNDEIHTVAENECKAMPSRGDHDNYTKLDTISDQNDVLGNGINCNEIKTAENDLERTVAICETDQIIDRGHNIDTSNSVNCENSSNDDIVSCSILSVVNKSENLCVQEEKMEVKNDDIISYSVLSKVNRSENLCSQEVVTCSILSNVDKSESLCSQEEKMEVKKGDIVSCSVLSNVQKSESLCSQEENVEVKNGDILQANVESQVGANPCILQITESNSTLFNLPNKTSIANNDFQNGENCKVLENTVVANHSKSVTVMSEKLNIEVETNYLEKEVFNYSGVIKDENEAVDSTLSRLQIPESQLLSNSEKWDVEPKEKLTAINNGNEKVSNESQNEVSEKKEFKADSKIEDLKIDDSKTEDSKMGVNLVIQESKIENTKIEELKTGDLKIGKSEIGDKKIEELKIEDLKTGDLEISETVSEIGNSKTEEPTIEDAKMNDSKIEPLKTDDIRGGVSEIEESNMEDPKMDDSKVGDSGVEESKMEDPKIEDSKIGDSELEESKVEELKNEDSLICEHKKEVVRKRIFSGEKRETLQAKTILVKDSSNADTLNDIYCFDGSDDSFNDEKSTQTDDSVMIDEDTNLATDPVSDLMLDTGDNSINDAGTLKSEKEKIIPVTVLENVNESGRPQAQILQNLRSKVVKNMMKSSFTEPDLEKEKGKSDNENAITENVGRSESPTLNIKPSDQQNVSKNELSEPCELESGTNSKSEDKVKKKRGRKPNSEKFVSSSISPDVSESKCENECDDPEISFKSAMKKEKENIETDELDLLSVSNFISESETKIHHVSPTRSGRKSYKKLSKEFVYEHVSSSSDIEYSSSKKKSGKNSPKSKMSSSDNSGNKIPSEKAKKNKTALCKTVKHNVIREKKSLLTPCSSSSLSTSHRTGNKTKVKDMVNYKCRLCDFDSPLRTHFKEHCCMHLGYKPIHCDHCDFQTCRRASALSHCGNYHDMSTAFKYLEDVENEKFIEDRINDSRKYVPKSYIPSPRKRGRKLGASPVFKSKTVSKKVVKCPLCSFCSHSDLAIRRHAFWKHNMCKYECPKCRFCSLFEKEVIRHYKKCHGKGNCSPVRHLAMELETIQSLNENIDQKSDQKNSFSTKLVKQTAKQKGNVVEKTVASSGNSKTKKCLVKSKSTVEKCPVCSFESDSVIGVKRHMFFRHRLCSWLCSFCSATFSSKDEAVNHALSSHIGEQPRVSRILPKTPSKTTKFNKTDSLSAYSTFDKPFHYIHRNKKGKKLYTKNLMKTRRRILCDDVASSGEKVDGLSSIIKLQTGISDSEFSRETALSEKGQDLDARNKDDTISSININEKKTEISDNKTALQLLESTNMSTSVVEAPSVSDNTHKLNSSGEQAVIVRRKPGRPPKSAKSGFLVKNRKVQDQTPAIPKKQGKKRKLDTSGEGNEMDTSDKNQDGVESVENSGNNLIKKKGRKKSNFTLNTNSQAISVNLPNDIQKYACDTEMSANNTGTNSDNTPKVGKKRGPKKKSETFTSMVSPAIEEITQINTDESHDDSLVKQNFMLGDIQQGQKKKMNKLYEVKGKKTESRSLAVQAHGNRDQVIKKSKIQTITTVADVHHSYVPSDVESPETSTVLDKSKESSDMTHQIGCKPEQKKKNKEFGFSNQISSSFNDDSYCSDSDQTSFNLLKKPRQKQKISSIIDVNDTDDVSSDASYLSDARKDGGKSGNQNELKMGKKKGRKKKIVEQSADADEIWTSWNSTSYALHPKKLEKVKVAYSCPYCNYAAPLRHQLRLHCYGRHTDRPACLIEFRNKGTPGRPGRPKGSKSKSKSKTGKSANDSYGSKQTSQPKVSSPVKDTLKNLNEVNAFERVDSGTLKQSPKKKKISRRFCNPLKPMVKHLNGCTVRVYDTFHACVDIDDIDHYLDKFGVRTLNMDMLTPKQFSKFMSKFGGNLQGVDL